MNLLFSTFVIVRLITKSNNCQRIEYRLIRRDVDGDAIGEGRFHRGILQEICMWCMMIAGVVYESSKSRWGFEFCDGMALSFATLNS